MIEPTILSWVTFIYLASFTLYLAAMIRGKMLWSRLASNVAIGGFLAHTVAFVLRWIASYRLGIGHTPLSNFYESLIFFAWSIMLLYLIIEMRTKNRSFGAFVIPFAFLALAFASLSPYANNRIQPLIPALQSNWLAVHVITCFLGYAAFTVACAMGVMFLCGDLATKAKWNSLPFFRIIPDGEALDELIYQSTVLGFVFLTLGIMTGAIWAHYAWGSYWSWDPKETWALVTWLIYAAMLHAHLFRKWQGKRMATMALIGFAAVLFTYLGVNYLPGLHSYGSF